MLDYEEVAASRKRRLFNAMLSSVPRNGAVIAEVETCLDTNTGTSAPGIRAHFNATQPLHPPPPPHPSLLSRSLGAPHMPLLKATVCSKRNEKPLVVPDALFGRVWPAFLQVGIGSFPNAPFFASREAPQVSAAFDPWQSLGPVAVEFIHHPTAWSLVGEL